MARALRIQYPGAHYHVTCRGNEKRTVFEDAQDQKTFLEKLSLSSNIYHVHILCYACMGNHFHLLLCTPEGNLSEFMRHFNISYTASFNRRYGRVGHLYQGRYKAFLIDADNYLLEVSRYIHLNPIRIKAFRKRSAKDKWDALLGYQWSSLPGYLALGKRKNFVNYETVLGYMGADDRKGRQAYRKFIKGGIDKDAVNPFDLGKGLGIVGEEGFVQWVKEEFLSGIKGAKREQPALRELGKMFEPEEMIAHFIRLSGEKREEICRKGKNSTERAMLMELLYRFCRITQPEIGRLVGGIDYSAVSQARSRLQKRLDRDHKLRQRFSDLGDQLVHLSKIKI